MAAARWDSENRRWQGLYITWNLWYGCDYRCPYCAQEMFQVWEKHSREHLGISIERWLQGWRRFHERHGCAAIDVIGGEPLRYPGALELLGGLARWHRLDISSNLSVPLEFLADLTARASPERMHLEGSYHPQSADWDEFVKKIAFLKSLGYEPEVRIVAWPPHLSGIQEKKDILERMGVRCYVLLFQGLYQEREYPRSYSDAERARLEALIPGIEWGYCTQERPTLGKPCGAGHVYANIRANGDVFRCSRDDQNPRSMGNFLEEGFRLHDQPQPCPYPYCNACGEHIFLWEDWTKQAASIRGPLPAPRL